MKVKYGRIGLDYNQTRKADPYLTERLLSHLNPTKGKIYLDIGCGTGNYTNVLTNGDLSFIGIDPSKEMLEKAKTSTSKIDWRLGTAEKTGLDSNSVDGIVGSLTIHHWRDLDKGFSELNGVLKAKGRIVIFTSTPSQMQGYWLNHYFPKMLHDSMVQMPSFDQVKQGLEKAGIEVVTTEKYFIKPDLQDYFLYCGKNRPELYLNDTIRHGISSFSDLSNQTEVEDGLKQLTSDIENDSIQNIIDEYSNDGGDYLFVIAEKL